MDEVSTLRLYLLRAMYALLLVGLGLTIWPMLFSPPPKWGHMHSVVVCMLTAISLTAAIGIRYPLRMLPLLFFELGWKVIWLLVIALPLWRAGELSETFTQTAFESLPALVIIPAVIPWGYVMKHYVRAPGERWKGK